jgi:hypothetical protein
MRVLYIGEYIEMDGKQLRKIRFEIVIAMLNDDTLLREQVKTYFK